MGALFYQYRETQIAREQTQIARNQPKIARDQLNSEEYKKKQLKEAILQAFLKPANLEAQLPEDHIIRKRLYDQLNTLTTHVTPTAWVIVGEKQSGKTTAVAATIKHMPFTINVTIRSSTEDGIVEDFQDALHITTSASTFYCKKNDNIY